MGFTPFQLLHWSAGLLLEFMLCLVAIRRGLFRRLPFFTSYLVLVVSLELARWVSYDLTGANSREFFVTYWGTQTILLLARGAVIGEICWSLLRPYRGVWKVARGFLLAVAGFLVLAATLNAHANGYRVSSLKGGFSLILTAERGLEFAVVGILLLGLAFCRYYGIRIPFPVALIALGLGFYSTVQIANNAFLNPWLRGYFSWWSQIRVFSFNVATVMWYLGVRKPLREPTQAPALLNPSVYDEVAPQMTLRLRQLNARLGEMLK
jgi:hypothetical protein